MEEIMENIELMEKELMEEKEDENLYLSSSINIHNITHDDMKNGTGLRVVLWVAGCSHHCKECQNPCTWDPNGGIPMTEWEEAEFWEWLSKPWTEGATFSGGDPLHPANRAYIAKLMQKVKEQFPEKNIWLYTGYDLRYSESSGFYFEDKEGNTFTYPALKYIDTLIDGRFMCEIRRADIQAGRKCLWRGSSNQRIIDVQTSLVQKNIITKGE